MSEPTREILPVYFEPVWAPDLQWHETYELQFGGGIVVTRKDHESLGKLAGVAKLPAGVVIVHVAHYDDLRCEAGRVPRAELPSSEPWRE